jgi:ABC-type transport system involved in multi-copper enzyme maturation permease subunit
MVWIALGLLAITVTVIALNTAGDRWGMNHWRRPRGHGPTFHQWLDAWALDMGLRAGSEPPAASLGAAVTGASRAILEQSGVFVFSSYVVFSVFLSFLLPIWSLSFATEAMGGEREDRNLVWLLTRPLPRPAIYLGKFVALLPWSLGLNLGGFALMCLAAGRPGPVAFRLYWPAVLGATLAFSALFHLMGTCFPRAAVVGIVYCFFLETVLGSMPGYMKRVSIGFYARCLMFESAEGYGVRPTNRAIYLPVDGTTAWSVLLGVTVLLLVVGIVVFSRAEYREEC